MNLFKQQKSPHNIQGNRGKAIKKMFFSFFIHFELEKQGKYC